MEECKMESVKYSSTMEVKKEKVNGKLFYKFSCELKTDSKDFDDYYSIKLVEADEFSNVGEILKAVDDFVKLNIDMFTATYAEKGIRPIVVSFNLDMEYSASLKRKEDLMSKYGPVSEVVFKDKDSN